MSPKVNQKEQEVDLRSQKGNTVKQIVFIKHTGIATDHFIKKD